MPNEVEFRPDVHEYHMNGRRLISVTQVLKSAGIINYSGINPMYAERGTSVHLAAEFEDKGTLDLECLDPRILPYLKAYRKFKRDSGATIVATEEKFAVEERGFAGTRDRRVLLNGDRAVIDLKTGKPAGFHGPQLFAYTIGLTEPHKRYGLYLSGDESFKLVEYSDPTDGIVWNAALIVAQWKRRHGIE